MSALALADDKTNATPDETMKSELARSVKRSLLPQAFPLRREIEFAAALDESADGTCFYDTLWLDPHTVAFAAMRIPAGGLEGAMAAAALKQLFRATLGKFHDPVATLETCGALGPADQIDAATVVLDLRKGSATSAASGHGGIFSEDGTATSSPTLSLLPGAALRLIIGDSPGSRAAIDAGTAAVSALAEQVLRDAKDAVAAAVILYKREVRPPGIETITLANDLSEIPQVLARLEQFYDHHGIEPQAVSGIDLAVDEILTNLVSYAFRDGARHMIDVEVAARDGHLSIEVRDDGAPFNPLKVPPPALNADLGDREVGGLGMHFVRTIADEVTYRREGGWNILHLTKKTNSGDKGGIP